MNDRIFALIIGAVVLVFVANFVLTVVDSRYVADPAINTIMGTVAGGSVAYYAAKMSRGSDNGKPKKGPKDDDSAA